MKPTATTEASSRALRSTWARLGFAGFLFFLLKGLIWLSIPALLWCRS